MTAEEALESAALEIAALVQINIVLIHMLIESGAVDREILCDRLSRLGGDDGDALPNQFVAWLKAPGPEPPPALDKSPAWLRDVIKGGKEPQSDDGEPTAT